MTTDLHSNLSVVQTLAPAARTASADGTGVDLANADGALVEIATGTITDGTHTIEVQESDDDVTYTAVVDADLIGTEPAIENTDGDSVYKVGYLGNKRYIRVSVTVANATSGGVYGANVIKGGLRKYPAA